MSSTKSPLVLRIAGTGGASGASAVLIVWLALALRPAGAAPDIGEAAPPLVLTGLNGQTFDLSKLRGKTVLVNYWATWCAPCRKEMPVLDAFYRHYHAQDLEMIGINVDFARDLEKVHRAARPIGYPLALSREITEDGFGPPEGVPVTYVIDAEGVVRDKFIAVPNKLLHDVVIPLLPQQLR
jgi:cytochrome c biogenesis protein CcmG, thiol:disulfide interchange protein DsbE